MAPNVGCQSKYMVIGALMRTNFPRARVCCLTACYPTHFGARQVDEAEESQCAYCVCLRGGLDIPWKYVEQASAYYGWCWAAL